MNNVAYDEKGKVFSQVIHKDAMFARIQTVTHLITGEIYLDPETRIKDELEFSEKFLAVTEAKVFGHDGKLVYKAPFITLNRDHIIWLALEDEPIPDHAPA
jgi:hypothetical protein